MVSWSSNLTTTQQLTFFTCIIDFHWFTTQSILTMQCILPYAFDSMPSMFNESLNGHILWSYHLKFNKSMTPTLIHFGLVGSQKSYRVRKLVRLFDGLRKRVMKNRIEIEELLVQPFESLDTSSVSTNSNCSVILI